MAKQLCYAKPTRRSWLLNQASMTDISQLKEDLEQKVTTWQWEVYLKVMKSLWGPHVRTREEDELSEECVCEPPQACLCWHRQPETVQRDLIYAYQGLKDTTKDADPVENHLPASIYQGTSNLHSDEDLKDKITLLDHRVIRTHLEVFGERPLASSCDKCYGFEQQQRSERASRNRSRNRTAVCEYIRTIEMPDCREGSAV